MWLSAEDRYCCWDAWNLCGNGKPVVDCVLVTVEEVVSLNRRTWPFFFFFSTLTPEEMLPASMLVLGCCVGDGNGKDCGGGAVGTGFPCSRCIAISAIRESSSSVTF